MESVKLIKFSGQDADFDIWKRRFTAYGKRRGYGPAFNGAEGASAQQQAELYADLLLALPDADMHLIINIDEDDAAAGHKAWRALVAHYEDDGLHRKRLLEDELAEPQRDGESCMEFYNRLVHVRSKLAHVGETVTDDQLKMKIIRGLRDDYNALTDTLDEQDGKLGLQDLKTELNRQGRRIEHRLSHQQTRKPTAFTAMDNGAPSGELASLQRQIDQLQQLLKQQVNSRPGGGGGGRPGGAPNQSFKGVCWGCGMSGHRKKDCPKKSTPTAAAAAAPVQSSSAEPGEEYKASPVAFTAVTHLDLAVASVDAETASPIQTSSSTVNRLRKWLVDSGANAHMTSERSDFVDYTAFQTPRPVRGVCGAAVGSGDVRFPLVDTSGATFWVVVRGVLHVPELYDRAGGMFCRLLSVSKMMDQGHC